MKKLFAIALLASFTTLAAPLQWTCDWPEAKSQTFSLYQGETATFEPTFRVNGRTVTNATIEAVWYQTNGMGNAWWKLDGATFAPSNDVGAAAYRFFVEASVPGSPFPVPQTIYRANGALRMLPSPGFTPNAIEPPIVTLDFANIDVANAPYYDKTETEAKIVELAPAPDYSTNNAALVETIEATAPAPGDYAAVSNAAVHAAITNALQDAAIESNRVNMASNRVAISTLSDSKLDLAGGTMTGGIAFGAQGTYGFLGLVYDDEDHRLRIIDGWNENQAYLEVPNTANGSRAAFTSDIDAAISTLSDSISSLSTNVDAKLDKSGNDFTVSHTADGLRIADNAGVYSIDVAPNRVRTNFPDEQPHDVVWPQLGGTLALTSDIPDVPAAIENTVTTAYVREKLGAWMEYDEATGLYYYCHEEE